MDPLTLISPHTTTLASQEAYTVNYGLWESWRISTKPFSYLHPTVQSALLDYTQGKTTHPHLPLFIPLKERIGVTIKHVEPDQFLQILQETIERNDHHLLVFLNQHFWSKSYLWVIFKKITKILKDTTQSPITQGLMDALNSAYKRNNINIRSGLITIHDTHYALTPLTWAVLQGDSLIIRLLLGSGASITHTLVPYYGDQRDTINQVCTLFGKDKRITCLELAKLVKNDHTVEAIEQFTTALNRMSYIKARL